MKFPSIVLFLMLTIGCHSQTRQPKVPATDASLKELRFNLNNLLTVQLPSTQPDSLNGVRYLKTYSANFNRNDSTTLEIPELRRTVDKDSIFGGSKYFLPLSNIDLKQVRIVTSPDEKYAALLIPAKTGLSFRHEPFGNEPARQVEAVTIGWYDRVQDRTLDRAYVCWMQYLSKLVN